MATEPPKDGRAGTRDGQRNPIAKVELAPVDAQPASPHDLDAVLIDYIYDLAPPSDGASKPPPLAADPDETGETRPIPVVSSPPDR